ncbi:hypothetical protein BHE74_00025255 [Ensete ventricosum]|nr:hypothetical protein BHE74_00025255 [Ensete ventricosum]RZR79729.1 hypothetical protein BHM03_00005534 [Ensete ventricosum]
METSSISERRPLDNAGDGKGSGADDGNGWRHAPRIAIVGQRELGNCSRCYVRWADNRMRHCRQQDGCGWRQRTEMKLWQDCACSNEKKEHIVGASEVGLRRRPKCRDLLLSTVAEEGVDRGGCNEAGRVSSDSRGHDFPEEESTSGGSGYDYCTPPDAMGNRRGVDQWR